MMLMGIRYQACLKIWASAYSATITKSYFITEYFDKSIGLDFKGNSIKYSINVWEQLNKALT